MSFRAGPARCDTGIPGSAGCFAGPLLKRRFTIGVSRVRLEASPMFLIASTGAGQGWIVGVGASADDDLHEALRFAATRLKSPPYQS